MDKHERAAFRKVIREEIKELPATGTVIEGCHFVGVQYDAKAVDAIQTIANGLVANAQALGKLAEVLKASNVTIEALVKFGG